MDIQEQAISKKQQMMDFCVGKALEIIKESIETRAEPEKIQKTIENTPTEMTAHFGKDDVSRLDKLLKYFS